jgi:hypothetical protein
LSPEQELAVSVDGVDRDLRAFIERLRDWTSAQAPEHAQAVAEGFRALIRLS